MQYVRNLSGSVAKTWNSINPATLSGAIDVIVVEQADGSLACSPFHVRFGKFMTLRPYDRKVEFTVNDVKQEYAMKLGEGGEAFFVFETTAHVPDFLQTSPLVSPAQSPEQHPVEAHSTISLPEPEAFNLGTDEGGGPSDEGKLPTRNRAPTLERRAKSELADFSRPSSPSEQLLNSSRTNCPPLVHSSTDETLPSYKTNLLKDDNAIRLNSLHHSELLHVEAGPSRLRTRSASPPPVSAGEAVARAISMSKKLWSSNIPSQVTDSGDLMLDMTGYKATPEESIRAEGVARKILAEEFEDNFDIGALIEPDDQGNVWIYSSEEAKQAANRRTGLHLNPKALASDDAISDPGYHSDDARSEDLRPVTPHHQRRDSDSAVDMSNSNSPGRTSVGSGDVTRNYAKTLRLTSDQLKALDLKPGANMMSFSVNNGKTKCQAYMYLWSYDVPIVISDIDGTITKSDALGHVLNMIGRDWTHLGVAKLYTDITANGYNIFYLTSRSVGQADTTRNYLNSVLQDGYRLPKGPVIMSPDRTMAALRREIYLRKPEVFKMACLRDIMNLFVSSTRGDTPFYAGFGNRLTDALSYRSVNIPSTRIFTINSNAEVSLDLLSLNKYKTGYTSMREIVDHFFPPVTMLVSKGGEQFTDFNYWRERPLDIDEFSASESEDEESQTAEGSIRSEDDVDMEASYFSENTRASFDDTATGLEESLLGSIEEADQVEAELFENLDMGMADDEEEADDADEEALEADEDNVRQRKIQSSKSAPRAKDDAAFQESTGPERIPERKRANTLRA